MSAYKPGDRVTTSGYSGTIIREYLPDMYEVRLASGAVVVDAIDIHPEPTPEQDAAWQQGYNLHGTHVRDIP